MSSLSAAWTDPSEASRLLNWNSLCDYRWAVIGSIIIHAALFGWYLTAPKERIIVAPMQFTQPKLTIKNYLPTPLVTPKPVIKKRVDPKISKAPVVAEPVAQPIVSTKTFEESIVQNVAPKYPRIALKRKWSGAVLLQMKVNRQGKIESLRIERSSGHRVLDESALKAARQWTFRPAVSQLYYIVQKEIVFRLKSR